MLSLLEVILIQCFNIFNNFLDKNDFKTKDIYKERYDCTDVVEQTAKFKNQRKEKLQKVVDLSVDNTFKDSHKTNLKLTDKDQVDRGIDREHKKKQLIDNFVTKEKWFSENKYNDYGRAATADAKFVCYYLYLYLYLFTYLICRESRIQMKNNLFLYN